MEQFRNETKRIAAESTTAHFGAEFNVNELAEGECAVYELFTAMDWSKANRQLELQKAIKQNESRNLNVSQRAFYHYLRNVMQLRMIESL